MKQLTQKLKDGDMAIQDVPVPVLGDGMVLVRNHYSVISAGTEGSTVKTARKSLIGKAKERPQQVKQVLDVLQKQGPVQTYRAVMKKLDAYSPLGYSSAGEVIDVGEHPASTGIFKVGDLVACAGVGYANHAEVVAVPINLCVKLSPDANLRSASYNTLGSIAMQGVRQADLRIGESCAVIGLGLIGQLTGQILRAGGIRVVGIDLDADAIKTAQEHSVDLAILRSAPGVESVIEAFTNGVGVDAVVIAAGTDSLDPINFAGAICRKRGRVVVVGAVPTGFDRDPYYYRKELDLRMSCSYGPGRYDAQYEEKGVDYPVAYVRWTENRNMAAFQQLLISDKINVAALTTHEFNFNDASKAYEMIVNRTEPFLGVVLKYDATTEVVREPVRLFSSRPSGKVELAFIGAGSYAQGNLLPNIQKNDSDIVRRGVLTSSGTTSKGVAEKFGFEFCCSDDKDIFDNSDINTVFVATRHDSHAKYVVKALEAGKNIYVEKPICLNAEELSQISEVYHQSSTINHQPSLMVGFNRRFAPLAKDLKKAIGAESGPVSMLYRINAGKIPADSWIHDKDVGGGRIIGEVCHFIDFMVFVSGSLPVSVDAVALDDPQNLNDTLTVNMKFANGSIGTIAYFANGGKSLPKEYVEVYRGGVTCILDDFKKLDIYAGRHTKKKLLNQDKGQPNMVKAFLDSLKSGAEAPIPFEEIEAVTKTAMQIAGLVR